MKTVVFYLLVLGFTSGIFLRSFFVIGESVVLLFILLSLAFAIVYRLYQTDEQGVLFVSVFLLAVTVGLVRYDLAENFWGDEFTLGEQNIVGEVVREPEVRENTQHLYVRSGDELLLVIADKYQPVAYGDRLRLTGDVELPESFTTDFGRTFNYPGYLKAKGVRYLIYDPTKLEIISHNEGNSFLAFTFRGKQRFEKALSRVLPEPALGLGEGLLLGEKRALGEELLKTFRQAGIIHIVVLSGYNVMLVVGSLLFLLAYFLPRRWRMWGALLGIIWFALLVGLSATVLRASIMAALFVISYSLGRSYALLRSLSLAGVVMLLVNPYLLIYDIGFQLSFIATLGLILALPVIENSSFTGLLKYFHALVVTTVATQIMVLPLLIYHIGEVSLVSVLVNMMVIPAVPLAMLFTFITGVAALIYLPLASIVAYFAYLALSFIILVAKISTTLPFATTVLPPVSGYVVFVLYLALLIIYLTIRYLKNYKNKKNDLAGWQIEEEPAEL